MNLNVIIAQLKQRAPIFTGGTVAGAAQFQVLPESANLRMPAAYVVPLDEQPEDQSSQNGYQQTIREGFAVVVALSNVADERGQKAVVDLDTMRKALFKALLGFQPGEDFDAIAFEGGQLLHLDRARMYYQFEFSADYAVSTEDTWIPDRNAELPDFLGLDIDIDVAQPDGQIEARMSIDLPQ